MYKFFVKKNIRNIREDEIFKTRGSSKISLTLEADTDWKSHPRRDPKIQTTMPLSFRNREIGGIDRAVNSPQGWLEAGRIAIRFDEIGESRDGGDFKHPL